VGQLAASGMIGILDLLWPVFDMQDEHESVPPPNEA
jgi:hypothetical protein